MTVKSTISFVNNRTKNDIVHDSASGSFTQYLRSLLANLHSMKNSVSPPSTAAVMKGLTTARTAIPIIRKATWHTVKKNIE
jgi:hypothetical protein